MPSFRTSPPPPPAKRGWALLKGLQRRGERTACGLMPSPRCIYLYASLTRVRTTGVFFLVGGSALGGDITGTIPRVLGNLDKLVVLYVPHASPPWLRCGLYRVSGGGGGGSGEGDAQ